MRGEEEELVRVSGKLRRKVVDAVNDVVFSMLDEYCPSSKDCPPEEWSPAEKNMWDLISEAGRRIETRLGDVFVVEDRAVPKRRKS